MPTRLSSSLIRTTLAVIVVACAAVLIVCDREEAMPVPAQQPGAATYSSFYATRWYDAVYGIIRDERLPPPRASRIFGYAGVALYESVAPGMPGYVSLSGRVAGLKDAPQATPGAGYHWPTAANAAMASVLKGLLASGSEATHQRLNAMKADGEQMFAGLVAEDVLARSRELGTAVGGAIYQWSLTDGAADLPDCQFVAAPGPGAWLPTPPGFAAPLEPCWGKLRPFVLASGGEFLPPPPAPHSTDKGSEMYRLAEEVYTTKNSLTPEQEAIARFWSDDPGTTGTPPGHSLAILTQLLREQGRTLDFAAEAYARTGIAVADAFISCWNTKYVYNLLRPVTYINFNIDPNWLPLLNTPPFPEYTSGHSVQTAASFAVLAAMLGDGPFVDRTHVPRGLRPRQFESFGSAADEAALSRLYGGIHYRPAIELGLAEGRSIGQKVLALKFKE